MAVTTIHSNNKGIRFRNSIIREYVRGNMFSPYMGEGNNAVIRSFNEEGKYGGDVINVPLVGRLKATAIGAGTLSGNEEAIDNYGFRMWLDWARNAVKATKSEIKKGHYDIFAQAQPLLSEWGRSLQRDEVIKGLMAIPSESPPTGLGSSAGQRINGILWSAATAAEKNAWLTANADRVLFGVAKGNTVAGNVASSLLNVDATADKASAAMLRVAKEMAELTDPRITPLTTDDGYERFVVFVGSRGYRDLWADPEIYAANRDARPREGGTAVNGNPIFKDGDLLYNGLIIRKVPEIDKLVLLAGAGATGVDVAPMFMCGQNAMGLIYGQMPEPTKLDDTDYQFLKGVGIEMAYGIGKLAKKDPTGTKLVDNGVVTVFHAAPATA